MNHTANNEFPVGFIVVDHRQGSEHAHRLDLADLMRILSLLDAGMKGKTTVHGVDEICSTSIGSLSPPKPVSSDTWEGSSQLEGEGLAWVKSLE